MQRRGKHASTITDLLLETVLCNPWDPPIRSSNSWVLAHCNWLLSMALSRELYKYRSDYRGNIAPNNFSIVSPLSLFVCVSPLSLLGNGFVNTLPWQWIHMLQQKNCWICHFLCSLCHTKGKQVVSSPWTSCLLSCFYTNYKSSNVSPIICQFSNPFTKTETCNTIKSLFPNQFPLS
jgi:hypothetical protein